MLSHWVLVSSKSLWLYLLNGRFDHDVFFCTTGHICNSLLWNLNHSREGSHYSSRNASALYAPPLLGWDLPPAPLYSQTYLLPQGSLLPFKMLQQQEHADETFRVALHTIFWHSDMLCSFLLSNHWFPVNGGFLQVSNSSKILHHI